MLNCRDKKGELQAVLQGGGEAPAPMKCPSINLHTTGAKKGFYRGLMKNAAAKIETPQDK